MTLRRRYFLVWLAGILLGALPPPCPGQDRRSATELDFPLTWEAKASQAHYEGNIRLDERFTKNKICAPHTWHAAEMFLAIQDLESKRQPAP